MDPYFRRHFLEAVQELGTFVADSEDEYGHAIAAGTVRKLFFDTHSMADRVCKELRMSLLFDINVPEKLEAPPVSGMLAMTVFTPGWWNPTSPHRRRLKRDHFFNLVIGEAGGDKLTVAALVKYVAFVCGGAHLGVPKSDIERALKQCDDATEFLAGVRGNLKMMCNVGMVVHDSLQPAVERLR